MYQITIFDSHSKQRSHYLTSTSVTGSTQNLQRISDK